MEQNICKKKKKILFLRRERENFDAKRSLQLSIMRPSPFVLTELRGR